MNQHAWLDPKNGVIYVMNIAAALAKSDPANAPDYRARAAGTSRNCRISMPGRKTEMAAVRRQARILSSHDSCNILQGYGIRC